MTSAGRAGGMSGAKAAGTDGPNRATVPRKGENTMLTIGLLFWILMILALLFGIYQNRANLGGSSLPLFLWFLLFLIGWQVFGFPLSGPSK